MQPSAAGAWQRDEVWGKSDHLVRLQGQVELFFLFGGSLLIELGAQALGAFTWAAGFAIYEWKAKGIAPKEIGEFLFLDK